MRTLHLILKKKWFDMIASGEKKEEYRDISKHWISRLCETKNILDGFKDFDAVVFQHAYAKNAPTIVVECLEIDVARGKPEWGANPDIEYFVIRLGALLNSEPNDKTSVASKDASSTDAGHQNKSKREG